ncbi:MAG: co-chaperone DjlA [Proteobacteria bacterium]|uniref:co-chaperone DjlA n=1 Tax=Rudaea sp. TaxID=2136325 RepID=UPI001D505D0D|nr:co-chaperone DjlA [Pseudomonadota bacterium]MBS0568104.1 co-chaperone DjlA [Pseudomonadota bacterium]
MKIWGKLIGLAIGVAAFHNPPAIVICVLLGHIFDRSMGSFGATLDAAPLSFVAPLFGLAGAIAKSDGRVSEAEIAATEQLMARLQLSSELRGVAVGQFTAGKQTGYSTTNAIVHLRTWTSGRRDRSFILVDLLLDIVCADGPLAPAKLVIVRKLCAALGVDERQLIGIAVMKGYAYVAPDNWEEYVHARHQDRARGPAPGAARSKDPYAVLGVERTASDAEIKRAYRKLMSQHHPDKLGDVPDEMKRRAEERARDINAAFEQIRSARGT